MKFWELTVVLASDPDKFLEVLRRPEWEVYREWYENEEQHVRHQNRAVLDAEVPHGLCEAALEKCSRMYWTDGAFLAALTPHNLPGKTDEIITALIAFRRYGGSPLETAIEKMYAQVSPPSPQVGDR